MAEAAERQKGQARALSLYYRGSILNRLGRYEQAQMSLDARAAGTARFGSRAAGERANRSGSLAAKRKPSRSGRYAVERNPGLVVANNQLAGAAAS